MSQPSPAGAVRTPAGPVLFALAIGAFAIGTTEFATMSLLPYFARDLGIDAPTAGRVISAYALGVVVGAPLLTVLAARMARRTLLVALMGVFALFNGLCAFAPSYGWLLALRFLSGLPHGAYFGIGALMAVSLVPQNKRNQAVGRMFLGLTVATIVGAIALAASCTWPLLQRRQAILMVQVAGSLLFALHYLLLGRAPVPATTRTSARRASAAANTRRICSFSLSMYSLSILHSSRLS